MRKSLIPNFLFYPNIDNSKVIKNSFSLFKEKLSKIATIKKKANNFLLFYNFTFIYFYIGNFFIKNKLKKTLKNLLYIGNNYYILSNNNSNFSDNINFFLQETIKFKKYNINKVILYLNNQYYLALDVINSSYHYYLFFSVFLVNIKLNLIYLNLNILNTFYILKKKLLN